LAWADILATGPMTSEELATKVEVNPGAMRRLMRALVAHGIFEELEVGVFVSMPQANCFGGMFLARSAQE
jgi:hypothetical protein